MSAPIDDRNRRLTAILTSAPVVPVLTIEDRDIAVPLARALVAGGLTALEITLRTAAGLDSIRAIAGEVEGKAGTPSGAAHVSVRGKAGNLLAFMAESGHMQPVRALNPGDWKTGRANSRWFWCVTGPST